MAKRLFTSAGRTYTNVTAGSAPAALTYMALKGGSTTQIIDVLEILFSGKLGTSTVVGLVFKRVSTLETGTPSFAAPDTDGPMHAATAALALPPVSFNTSTTTQPTVSNAVTDATLQLGLNAFGGIIRWNAAPTQQWTIVGNTVTVGESILVNSTSHGGVAGVLGDAHIMYEPY